MKTHSKSLETTAMWKNYLSGLPSDDSRITWVHQIYDSSITYLKDVRLTFQNYTLHDETHVLNVLDAMEGILGDQITQLTTGEAELLILAACLHDLGMVYTDAEAAQYFANKKKTYEFLRTNCPELLGCPAEEWPNYIRQWYLRSMHPFRLPEVLESNVWKDLFSTRPTNGIPKRCILAVCQAHGEAPEEFAKSNNMEYLNASDTDPLFCALLLRLADLLDFDDTRAPKVLYSYVICNEQSRAEWDKHRASGGFRFPSSPSTATLPYRALCTNPGIEHTIRDFLKWIDIELNSCTKLQQKCHKDWQRSFPFPRAISHEEIESDGYVSGDFQMTMDQTQVMELLTGEQLYDKHNVFVRELLQNSIDATLLRAKLDRNFSLQDARIDLWEWSDKDGNIWFRIDDQGTGMTSGMLQRYFLKIGNSYYTSQELQRDLRDHGYMDDYHSISRFGIGFLSCFICGTFAEVSTLYFDSQKNLEESNLPLFRRTADYGLRLQVTGLKGYYTLKSQAEHHQIDHPLPAPSGYDEKVLSNLEQDGYRAKPGTSISIRLDPGRLGAINLYETVKEYLCCAQIPVYYNGKQVGHTHEETMQAVRSIEGKSTYEFTPELQEKFDKCFPSCLGKYPKVFVTVVPLDTKAGNILPNLSGVFIKYDVQFEETPTWQVKERHYKIGADITTDSSLLRLYVQNTDFNDEHLDWDDFIQGYPHREVKALEAALKKLSSVPASSDELGDAWLPFASERVSPGAVWQMWVDSCQTNTLKIPLNEFVAPVIATLTGGKIHTELTCSYQGIVAGNLCTIYRYVPRMSTPAYSLLLLLDGRLRPTTKASRSDISNIPLDLVVAIYGILNAWVGNLYNPLHIPDWSTPPLPAWRKLRGSNLEYWLKENLQDYLGHMMEEFGQPLHSESEESLNICGFWGESHDALQTFYMSLLQDTYSMTVNYEEGQIITFSNMSSETVSESYDYFPPMMFCNASTEQSCRFLCCKDSGLRRCITANHPYTKWLLKNAALLNKYYGRQFQQVVNALRHSDSENIIKICNNVQKQLMSLPEHHGIDIAVCPLLSDTDFWMPASKAKSVLN